MCGVTEKVLVIDTPRALIESTRVMLGTAGGGILLTRRLRGSTKTISTSFRRLIARLFSAAQRSKLSISVEQN